MQGGGAPEQVILTLEDVQAFMEVLHGIPGPSIDLVVHSPGGSPTATEAIVNYIRTRFDDIRVFVPLAAMSAATMLACAANRIVMGKHSFLGPTDPQLILQTPLGVQSLPAAAIKMQFERAQADAANPQRFGAWVPMLQQYGPALLVQCDNVLQLSKSLVSTWLEQWMFADLEDAKAAAKVTSDKLNSHEEHGVHDRYLSRAELRDSTRLVIDDLEEDQQLQDAVLSVLHAATHTFAIATPVQKIVENHLGKSFIKNAAAIVPPPGARQIIPAPGQKQS